MMAANVALAAVGDGDRISWLSHAIEPSHLLPGDQIYCIRSGSLGVYSHHGIYIGEQEGCQVIHFTDPNPRSYFSTTSSNYSSTLGAEATVQCCNLDEFRNNDTVRLVAYGVSAWSKVTKITNECCHIINSMPAAEVVKVAKYYKDHPEEYDEYDLRRNNCETFACFCKTGRLDDIAGQYSIGMFFNGERGKVPLGSADEAIEFYNENRK